MLFDHFHSSCRHNVIFYKSHKNVTKTLAIITYEI